MPLSISVRHFEDGGDAAHVAGDGKDERTLAAGGL
jgi:hypothetical protein